MKLDVHFLPSSTTSDDVASRTVVVIDVLRATTTILIALAAGAREVIPCLEINDAKRIAAQYAGSAVTGGERGGVRIEGFTFGNSPTEYTPQAVGGRSLIFTTTNGTRAMQACRHASRVLLGAFVNRSRVISAIAGTDRVALLCAGTNNRITLEDVLFAGSVVSALRTKVASIQTNDEADLAAAAWDSTVGNQNAPEKLVDALRDSRGGRNLLELGYESDIRFAAQVDTHPILAELRLDQWRIISVE